MHPILYILLLFVPQSNPSVLKLGLQLDFMSCLFSISKFSTTLFCHESIHLVTFLLCTHMSTQHVFCISYMLNCFQHFQNTLIPPLYITFQLCFTTYSCSPSVMHVHYIVLWLYSIYNIIIYNNKKKIRITTFVMVRAKWGNLEQWGYLKQCLKLLLCV